MPARIEMFGVEIDPLTMEQAVGQVLAWVADPVERCRYVVTPNVDHIVMLQHHTGLQQAYQQAGMVLVDGAPVVWSSQLLRRPVPEQVAGSELVPRLLDAVTDERPLKAFFLGGRPGLAEQVAVHVGRRWPAVEVVGSSSPAVGFEHDETANDAIIEQIAKAGPEVLIVGFGAPQQELWVHRHRQRLAAKVALCIEGSIERLVGERWRGPQWPSGTRFDWARRMAHEPQRLAARYARDAWIFPRLLAREWWRLRRPAQS